MTSAASDRDPHAVSSENAHAHDHVTDDPATAALPNISGAVQDDTAAIQAALAAALEGGLPSLPPGNYVISAPLVVRRHDVTSCLGARDGRGTIP